MMIFLSSGIAESRSALPFPSPQRGGLGREIRCLRIAPAHISFRRLFQRVSLSGTPLVLSCRLLGHASLAASLVVRNGRTDKTGKQWLRRRRLRFEFRMVLYGNKPR